jgi:hypothetical protein
MRRVRKTWVEAEVICAVCGRKSRQTSLGLVSIYILTEQDGWADLDGRPASPLRDTMPYWIQECPGCRHIARDITLPAERTQNFLKPCRRLSDELTDAPLAARFVRYASFLSYEGNFSGACDHFLYASWVYDDLKKATRARTMRRFALDFAHDLAGSARKSERCYYLLLKADLLRRMGRFAAVLAMNEKDDVLGERGRVQMFLEKKLALKGDEAPHSLEEFPGLLADDKLI